MAHSQCTRSHQSQLPLNVQVASSAAQTDPSYVVLQPESALHLPSLMCLGSINLEL